jgi:hypothetical protein
MNFQAMNKQRKFVLIAAAAGLIAMFLPWAVVSAAGLFDGLGGNDSGLGGSSHSENGMHGIGIIVFLSFLSAILVSLLGDQANALDETSWLMVMAAGAAALLFTIIPLSDTPTGSLGFVKSSVGYGAWIALAAAASVIGFAWKFKNPGVTLKGGIDKMKKGLNP